MNADIHVLTGAYACDALDLDEQDAFEEHLAGCESCAQEVVELRATAAALAAAEAVEPPEALRERVLAQIAVTRQLPPIVPAQEPRAEPESGTPPAERGPGRHGSRSGRPTNEGQGPGSAGGPTHRRPGGTARPGGPGRRWTRMAAWGSSTALVVGVLFLGGVVWHQQGEINSLHGQAQSVTQLLSEPDAHAVAGRVQTGGTLTVISSSSDNGMVFSASDLPALPSGKAYQLWMINGTGVRPGPVVEPVDGRIAATFAGGLNGAKTIAMTVEPSTGSAQPTTTPIAAVTLAS